MSEPIQVALLTALLNAAVTWGVITTKIAWLRRDLDRLEDRTDKLEQRP